MKQPRLIILTTALLAILTTASPALAGSSVSVFYAGSLSGINTNDIGPAFQTSTGYSFAGQGLGSVAIANGIKSGIYHPDVAEFADASVNNLLMGSANGNYVKWYINFGRSHLVIGWDPNSSYAKLFKKAAAGKIPWYKPLLARGLRIGRTDPQTDPKGYRTLFAFHLAQKVFKIKNFFNRTLVSDENPNQVFPESGLVSRLLAGQIDAGIFYTSEVSGIGVPNLSLPPQVNFGDPKYNKLYQTQKFTNTNGQTFVGSPIYYTITIPSTVTNQGGAEAFVKFVLSNRAAKISKGLGLYPTKHVIGGDKSAVPPGI